MVIGMMLSGIVAGFAGVAWAIAAGMPLLLVLAFYPAAGIVGALGFLGMALLRHHQPADYPAMGTVSEIH